MPVILGYLVGAQMGRVIQSRTFGLMLLWIIFPVLAHYIGNANAPPLGGTIAFIATLVGMAAYALHRPGSTPSKQGLLDGLLLWCVAVFFFYAAWIILRLFAVDMVLSKLHIGSLAWKAAVPLTIYLCVRVWIGRAHARALGPCLDQYTG